MCRLRDFLGIGVALGSCFLEGGTRGCLILVFALQLSPRQYLHP